MCDAELRKVITESSRDIFSSHYFKSTFAKSMVVELEKPASTRGTNQKENYVGSNIFCTGSKDCRESDNIMSRPAASFRSLDRNLIRHYTEYKGKYRFSGRATNFEKQVEECLEGHNSTDQQQQQFKFMMEEEYSPPSTSQLRHIDTVILQSRVETLQWQLKQTEESRHMYRSLMEHVMKFLERMCTNLDEISSTEQCKSLPTSVCNSPSHRVPRSQSALSMDASPCKSAMRANRDTLLNVSRAKSAAQIEESPNVFCDYTWRRSSKVTQHSEVTVQKLSQDTHRLLRTVQSLLSTNEPNLAHDLGVDDTCQRSSSRNNTFSRFPSDPESFQDMSLSGILPTEDSPGRKSAGRFSSLRREHGRNLTLPKDSRLEMGGDFPDTDSLRQSLQDLSLSGIISNHSSVGDTPSRRVAGSYSSLRREHGRQYPPLHSMLTLPKDSNVDSGADSPEGRLAAPSHYTASLGRPRKLKESRPMVPRPECYISDTPSEKQLSLSSNEDESGFSSMSSFQEVGLPSVPASSTPGPGDVSATTYPPVGVPVFEPGDCAANHRRWSSVPVDTHSQLGPVIPESVTVMWV